MEELESKMSKLDVIKLLGMIAVAYPNMKEVDDLTVKTWYECLSDIDLEVALAAVKKNILESPFPPTIADIRKQVADVVTLEEDRLDTSKAWGEVVKAMQVHGSYSEIEALKSMSPITRKVVKYIGWREICLSENLGVIRGQFLRMYETVATREKQDRLLPESFKRDIKQIAEQRKTIESLSGNMDMKKVISLE